MGLLRMIRDRDINTVLNHCKNALDMQIFTLTDRMMSCVITKHLCDYRNTVQILCIGTDRSQQTVQTKIRLLLIRVYAVCHSISIFWMH